MEPKKLWHYDNYKVDIFHHCEVYLSWQAFIKDDPFNCNCISGNPLLYWYWDNNTDEDYDKIADNFKRITLIYRSWFSGMAKIVILVTPEDEPDIKEFLQKNQMV